MSFDVTGWPLPDDIDRYQRELKVPRDGIVRDIARLVTVAQMVHDQELNNDLVLTGGMAMRLRGSPRFTMSDTDTSRRIPEAPDRDRLAEALTVDQAELTVSRRRTGLEARQEARHRPARRLRGLLRRHRRRRGRRRVHLHRLLARPRRTRPTPRAHPPLPRTRTAAHARPGHGPHRADRREGRRLERTRADEALV